MPGEAFFLKRPFASVLGDIYMYINDVNGLLEFEVTF